MCCGRRGFSSNAGTILIQAADMGSMPPISLSENGGFKND